MKRATTAAIAGDLSDLRLYFYTILLDVKLAQFQSALIRNLNRSKLYCHNDPNFGSTAKLPNYAIIITQMYYFRLFQQDWYRYKIGAGFGF